MFKALKYKDVKPLYTIDEYGNIYSKYKNDYIKTRKDKDGYLNTSLRGEKRTIYVRIATLVAYNFIGAPPKEIKDPTVDHIDGNILNNYYLNLRWLERSENSSIRKKRAKSRGELNHEAKLSETQVISICELLTKNIYTLREIANMFNVDKSTISNIKRKKNWCHIACKYDFPSSEVERDKKGKFYNASSTKMKQVYL